MVLNCVYLLSPACEVVQVLYLKAHHWVYHQVHVVDSCVPVTQEELSAKLSPSFDVMDGLDL